MSYHPELQRQIKASTAVTRSEADRLAALRALGVLDAPPDPELDALVREAAARFNAPMAVISLVDENRQWFRARHGLDMSQTPRSWSFCAHAIQQAAGTAFVVPDATLDPRFAQTPLVAGPPGVRFYAGVVVADRQGARLGAL